MIRRRDCEQLQAFWEQLKTSYSLLTKPERDIRLLVTPLSYTIGVMSGLLAPGAGNIGNVPGFEHFQADIVNLSDTLAVIDRFVILRNFVQHIAGDLALDLHYFVGHIADADLFRSNLVSGEIRKANQSTAALRAVKAAFEAEKAKLAKP
jgi:hypothetical protein